MATDSLGNLFVRITADTRDFRGKMTGAQRAVGDLTSRAQRLAGAFGLAFGAYTLGREIRSSIQAFAEQEKAVEGLRATLELTGRDGGGALDRLTEKAAALQRVTTAADEELIGATASLGQLAKELDTGELERAQEAIIGIADVFLKGDVNNAAILLGKTLGSTTNALTRYGIQVDSAASQSEKLRQVLAQSQIFFDASKAKALTLSGRLEQLGNAWGDLKEQVGDVVAQLAGFGPNADAAKGTIVRLTDAIKDNKEELVAWGKAATSILADILKIGAGILALKTAIGVARGLGIALGAIGIAAGTIPVAITALLAVLGGGVALFATFKDRVDKARASLQEFRREADRKIAFRVGLPEGRDTLIALRDATSRELERVQQDLERFRQRLGDETFKVAVSADVDGPFAEVRRLADEALALKRRLVEVGLAIRDWKPAADAGAGGAADVLGDFNLGERLAEARKELQVWAQTVDTLGRGPLEALSGQARIMEAALRDMAENGIARNNPAYAEFEQRLRDLVAAMDILQRTQQEQRRTLENWRTGIESVLPSADQFQQRMAAMATAAAQLGIALGNMDFTAFAAAMENLNTIVAGTVAEVASTAQSVTDQLTSQFVSMGFQMLSGIGQGMEKGANVIYSIMISIISKLIAIAVAKFIILSPSKLTAGWGENIVKGIAVGMEGQRRGLERTWLSVLDTITPPDPMSMSAVAGAAPIAPQIVVDMTGVTLFGDPAGEARKIGSQVFLREGMLVAREGGFGG